MLSCPALALILSAPSPRLCRGTSVPVPVFSVSLPEPPTNTSEAAPPVRVSEPIPPPKKFAASESVSVSLRSGKTPTCLYMVLQFGVKAANYPLIPEDFERRALPAALESHIGKLYGLTITPERLARIRAQRRPNSKYASLENCRYEVEQAEQLMQRHAMRCLNSTSRSIEEIAATILQDVHVERHGF